MAIDFQRAEYDEALPEWVLVDACCDEKNLGTMLPTINAHDTSKENKTRNEEYKDRASWFGASSFTLAGMIGTAYEDAPAFELPAGLDYLLKNCDGAGTDLQQQMQATTGQTLRKGRAGLFVTYPPVEGGASKQDQNEGRTVATIHLIDAKRIINWWTQADGAQVKIGGVVFWDTVETFDDYEIKAVPVLREIAMDGETGAAFDRIWEKVEGKGWVPGPTSAIVDSRGAAWSELPFCFVGSVDNTVSVDRPPMLSIARLNRAHYRNSADFEEAAFFAGQAQPWATGLHQEDVDQAKAAGFYVGSRQLIVADSFGFAQADPNMVSREAMRDKEAQMKALGARFLEPGTVAKTATEASGDMKVQHSILSLAVENVEDAYNRALTFAGRFMGMDGATVATSKEFMRKNIADERISRFIELWDRALVGPVEAHRVLTSANIVDPDKPADDYAEELEARGALTPGVDDDADA